LLLLLAGGSLYLFARIQEEDGKNVSLIDWGVNNVIGLIGIGIIIYGDRILMWTSLPDAVRWTTIGLILGAAIALYIYALLFDEGLTGKHL
jgi:hypothetical protein